MYRERNRKVAKERIARKALERIRRDADRKVDKIYELLERDYDYSFSYVELVQAAYIGTRKRIHKVFETLDLEFEDFATACHIERIRFRKILDSKPYGSVAGYYPESKWESAYTFLMSTYAY